MKKNAYFLTIGLLCSCIATNGLSGATSYACSGACCNWMCATHPEAVNIENEQVKKAWDNFKRLSLEDQAAIRKALQFAPTPAITNLLKALRKAETKDDAHSAIAKICDKKNTQSLTDGAKSIMDLFNKVSDKKKKDAKNKICISPAAAKFMVTSGGTLTWQDELREKIETSN